MHMSLFSTRYVSIKCVHSLSDCRHTTKVHAFFTSTQEDCPSLQPVTRAAAIRSPKVYDTARYFPYVVSQSHRQDEKEEIHQAGRDHAPVEGEHVPGRFFLKSALAVIPSKVWCLDVVMRKDARSRLILFLF